MLPVWFGLVGGVYAWTLTAYPTARRLHSRMLAGRDQWLAAAVALVVASQLGLVTTLGLHAGRDILTSLASIGSILTTVTVGTLIGELGGGLEESDWR
jgi:hypothetical protein